MVPFNNYVPFGGWVGVIVNLLRSRHREVGEWITYISLNLQKTYNLPLSFEPNQRRASIRTSECVVFSTSEHCIFWCMCFFCVNTSYVYSRQTKSFFTCTIYISFIPQETDKGVGLLMKRDETQGVLSSTVMERYKGGGVGKIGRFYRYVIIEWPPNGAVEQPNVWTLFTLWTLIVGGGSNSLGGGSNSWGVGGRHFVWILLIGGGGGGVLINWNG